MSKEKMKLLILTQKMDRDDPILGFFHRWVEEFAKHAESVIVICLEEGKHSLPSNVRVLSLGKESGKSKLKYVIRFYRYIWQERKNHDAVFVHMNQEYVLLGGLIWRLLGKKVLMWRNHAKGNFMTKLAVFLSNNVFCTSPESFTARFKKTFFMPVGIDTDYFIIDESVRRKKNSIIFVGRLSIIKNPLLLIRALSLLRNEGVKFEATFVGSLSSKNDKYSLQVIEESKALQNSGYLRFKGSIPNYKLPKIYNEHVIFVNLTPPGSLDKVIFEAMACGVIPVVHNRFLEGLIESGLMINTLEVKTIAKVLKYALNNVELFNPQEYRLKVVNNHDVVKLVESVISHA